MTCRKYAQVMQVHYLRIHSQVMLRILSWRMMMTWTGTVVLLISMMTMILGIVVMEYFLFADGNVREGLCFWQLLTAQQGLVGDCCQHHVQY